LITDVEINKNDITNYTKKINSIDELTNVEISNSIFYLYFTFDDESLYTLRKIVQNKGIFIPSLNFDKTSYRFTKKNVYNTLKYTWERSKYVSHLNIKVHENICEAIDLTKNLTGAYVEVGVYKGGSALTALKYLKCEEISREVYLLDTFNGFDYKEAELSSDFIWSGTHKLYGADETMKAIKNILDDVNYPFNLVKSNIITDNYIDNIDKIVVANIDVDIFEATMAALNKLSPKIVNGGIIILEDATSTPALYGAFLAMKDFLQINPIGIEFIPIFKEGQYFLLRK
jgi:hypothetical protein